MTASTVPVPRPPEDLPEADPRPVVALPRQGLPGAAIAVIAVLLALLLFAALNAQRQRAATSTPSLGRAQTNAFAPPPPLVVPPEPLPAPATVTVLTTPAPAQPPVRLRPEPAPAPLPPSPIIIPTPVQPSVVIEPRPPERPAPRANEPALVIDGAGDQAAVPGASQSAPGNANGARGGQIAGSDDAPARATPIGNRTTIMPVGTVIPAVLETPIDTARPGLLRAVVSEDTRGFDGRRVLVPRGSRLIGEYQADVRANQNRVLVTWTRLIRPDGVAIRLGSPASDSLGGAGVPGRLHTYFLQRFAGAVLQSALEVGVNLASRPRNGSVIVGLPGSTVTNTINQGLPSPNTLQPKITVKQGAALTVFVARDLDFSGVPTRP